MSGDYLKEFQYIRNTFFPTWDHKGQWRLELVDYLNGSTAFCRPEPKTIEVLKSVDLDKLPLILIHEITHAVTSCGHGKPWLSRRIKRLRGRRSWNERFGATDSIQPRLVWRGRHYRQAIYAQIVDAVINQPDADFMTLISVVGRDYGASGEELLESCKEARKVYDQARADALKRRQIRKELLK